MTINRYAGKTVAALVLIIASAQSALAEAAKPGEIAAPQTFDPLVVGQSYTIRLGKIGHTNTVQATLTGQRVFEGKNQYRFDIGTTDDFGAPEFRIVGDSQVVRYDAEGNEVKVKIARSINVEDVTARLAEAQAELIVANEREALVINQQYDIKLGRGDTTRVVAAILLGEATQENGAKQYNFFFGAGFDAATVKVYGSQVVRGAPIQEEEPEATEPDVDNGFDPDAELPDFEETLAN